MQDVYDKLQKIFQQGLVFISASASSSCPLLEKLEVVESKNERKDCDLYGRYGKCILIPLSPLGQMASFVWVNYRIGKCYVNASTR